MDSGPLHHVPKVSGGASGTQRSHNFQLSKEAYQKLTQNYNYSKVDSASRKNHMAYATQDLRFQNPAMQQKYGK